jgi:hypothetical protein
MSESKTISCKTGMSEIRAVAFRDMGILLDTVGWGLLPPSRLLKSKFCLKYSLLLEADHLALSTADFTNGEAIPQFPQA